MNKIVLFLLFLVYSEFALSEPNYDLRDSAAQGIMGPSDSGNMANALGSPSSSAASSADSVSSTFSNSVGSGSATSGATSPSAGSSGGGFLDSATSSLTCSDEKSKDGADADLPIQDIEAANAGVQGLTATADVLGVLEINKSFENYKSSKASCTSRQSRAATACLERCSPKILESVPILNTLLSTVGSAVADNCSKFASAMDVAKGIMTAYTAECGAFKYACDSACSSSLKGLQEMQSLAEAAQAKIVCKNPVGSTNCFEDAQKKLKALIESVKKELDTSNKKSVAGKQEICTGKYAQLLTSAVSGIGSLVNSMMQGKKCQNQTAGTPASVAVAPLTADQCADPKNANMPDCICQKNPRTPGCANTFQKPGANGLNNQVTAASSPSGMSPVDRSLAGLQTNSGLPPINAGNVNDPGGGAAGPPVGGGGAGLGGGGGGAGGGPGSGNGESGKNGIDLEKYSSGLAGGGGGGRYNGSSSGSNSSDKYRSYLPGGAKDPNRGIAGQQAWTKEVTGQGGKSNWEKVKERYNDNKNTLINN
ncbi:MAG: hypothetical protein ACXVCY_00905 [Pseudobdellovibrionaceae bacterium]